jgi:hypothetical protein
LAGRPEWIWTTGGGNGGGIGSAVANGLLGYYTFDDGTADDVTDNELNGRCDAPRFYMPCDNLKNIFLSSC